jgi:hypothetical protein
MDVHRVVGWHRRRELPGDGQPAHVRVRCLPALLIRRRVRPSPPGCRLQLRAGASCAGEARPGRLVATVLASGPRQWWSHRSRHGLLWVGGGHLGRSLAANAPSEGARRCPHRRRPTTLRMSQPAGASDNQTCLCCPISRCLTTLKRRRSHSARSPRVWGFATHDLRRCYCPDSSDQWGPIHVSCGVSWIDVIANTSDVKAGSAAALRLHLPSRIRCISRFAITSRQFEALGAVDVNLDNLPGI